MKKETENKIPKEINNQGEGKQDSSIRKDEGRFKSMDEPVGKTLVESCPNSSNNIPKRFITGVEIFDIFGFNDKDYFLEKSIYDKRVQLIKEIIEQCDSSCSKEVVEILNGYYDE